MTPRRTVLAVLLAFAVVAAAATVAGKGKRHRSHEPLDLEDLLGDDAEDAPEPRPSPRPAPPEESRPAVPPLDVVTPVEPRRGSGLLLGLVAVGAVLAGGATLAARRRARPAKVSPEAPAIPPPAPVRAPSPMPAPAKPARAPAVVAPVPPPAARAPVPAVAPPVPAPAAPPRAAPSGDAAVGLRDGGAAASLSRAEVLAYLLAEIDRTDADGDVVRLAPGGARAAGGKGCAYARGYLQAWYAAAMGRDVSVTDERCDDASCLLRVRWS